ncbi:endonuclease V [Tumidithrix elongata]
MKLAVDVHYKGDRATVGGILFENWSDRDPTQELTCAIDSIEDYEPGQFYKRELPCILKLLEVHQLKPACIAIDGFVYLDGFSKPGLGKYLYDALCGEVPIVGVAKTLFRGISPDYAVCRGDSEKPLFVTAIGLPISEAKEVIRTMHGSYRIPSLLKRVDRICRDIPS